LILLLAKVVEDKPVDKVRCPSVGAKNPNLNFITKHGIWKFIYWNKHALPKKNIIVQQHNYTTHEMQEEETVASNVVKHEILRRFGRPVKDRKHEDCKTVHKILLNGKIVTSHILHTKT